MKIGNTSYEFRDGRLVKTTPPSEGGVSKLLALWIKESVLKTRK
jgi:hypothetical protein